MPLKSTQTNKYETACFVQEAGVGANMDRGTLKILKNKYDGRSYCKFDSVLWSFAGKNRMISKMQKSLLIPIPEFRS